MFAFVLNKALLFEVTETITLPQNPTTGNFIDLVQFRAETAHLFGNGTKERPIHL